jgi:hypothetical protein
MSETNMGERIVVEFDGFRVVNVESRYVVDSVVRGRVTRHPEFHMSHEDMQALFCALDIALTAAKKNRRAPDLAEALELDAAVLAAAKEIADKIFKDEEDDGDACWGSGVWAEIIRAHMKHHTHTARAVGDAALEEAAVRCERTPVVVVNGEDDGARTLEEAAANIRELKGRP